MDASPAPSILSLYRSQHAILSIYLTNRCNLLCRHCGTNSGPSETSYLRLDDDAIANLRHAIDVNGIRALHVSGGEPFLRRADLQRLSALAQETGILLAINTNGYWGISIKSAVKLLQGMPGVTEIILSTDVYHAEQLGTEKVLAAAQAGLACARQVSIVTTTPTAQPTLFTVQLDADLDRAGILASVQRLNQLLEPTARAVPLRETIRIMSAALPSGPCHQLNRPTVLENGAVLACCNTTAAKRCADTPLNLGNIHDTPLANLLHAGREHRLLEGLRLLGPAVLVDTFLPRERARLPRYAQGDVCALCTDLLTDAEMMSQLDKVLAGNFMDSLLRGARMLTQA
jgi:hypothetical protein